MQTTSTRTTRTLRALTSSPLLHHPTAAPTRPFTTSQPLSSNIGGAPLTIPPGVTLDIIPPPAAKGKRTIGRRAATPTVDIKGPLGQLKMSIPNFVKIDMDDATRKASVTVDDRAERSQREMWGTTRAYLANHLIGVSEGHNTLLRLVGVGYRATIESTATTTTATYPGQKYVSLKVGYSHPIELGIPQGVKASTPQPTRILLEGSEKEVVKSFAAKIRKWRVPEPYKGKGIFVDEETIRLKAKKIK